MPNVTVELNDATWLEALDQLRKGVIDFATGSGLVGIAAMKAGAARVLGADIDAFCQAAVALNARANGVVMDVTERDLLDAPAPPGAPPPP